MMSSDGREVLTATRTLLERIGETAPTYARLGASTRYIALLAVKAGAEVHYFPFGSTAAGMAYPKVGGVIPIFVDSTCTRADQMLTALHEIAHAWRGEVEEPTYLTAADTDALSERVADLFAVVGLAPTSWMRSHLCDRRGRLLRRADFEVVLAYREYTKGWSERRLRDRARLRVQLYREHGI